MKLNNPSLTANRVAMMRAAHQILDNPIVFNNPLAPSFHVRLTHVVPSNTLNVRRNRRPTHVL